uniref:Fibrinogen C-terminal domain-containing protein n=1 Tax=Macrostomum lignano TaxID=282301 RepID=A0A1I8FAC5_9PLAT
THSTFCEEDKDNKLAMQDADCEKGHVHLLGWLFRTGRFCHQQHQRANSDCVRDLRWCRDCSRTNMPLLFAKTSLHGGQSIFTGNAISTSTKEHCKTDYRFRSLEDGKVGQGWNFRHAYHYEENGVHKRTLVKAFGIQFFISVTGRGGKFDILNFNYEFGLWIGAAHAGHCAVKTPSNRAGQDHTGERRVPQSAGQQQQQKPRKKSGSLQETHRSRSNDLEARAASDQDSTRSTATRPAQPSGTRLNATTPTTVPASKLQQLQQQLGVPSQPFNPHVELRQSTRTAAAAAHAQTFCGRSSPLRKETLVLGQAFESQAVNGGQSVPVQQLLSLPTLLAAAAAFESCRTADSAEYVRRSPRSELIGRSGIDRRNSAGNPSREGRWVTLSGMDWQLLGRSGLCCRMVVEINVGISKMQNRMARPRTIWLARNDDNGPLSEPPQPPQLRRVVSARSSRFLRYEAT